MNKTSIIFGIATFCLIIFIAIFLVASMENRFTKDCAEQNFEGIIKYWDLDINCSSIENIKDRVVSSQSIAKTQKTGDDDVKE